MGISGGDLSDYRLPTHQPCELATKPGSCHSARLPGTRYLHAWSHDALVWYRRWHHHALRPFVHWSTFAVALLIALSGILTALNSPQPAQAATGINAQLPFQGRLTTSSGATVSDGSYDVVFKLYSVSSGGTADWTESHTGVNQVTVTNGIFSTLLGSVTALSSNFNTDTWYLGITVGADAEMTPRIRLGAAPYALNADLLDGISSTGFAILAGQAGGQTLLGGTAVGDDLTLQTTSGVGSGDQIIFKAGTNGATTPLIINQTTVTPGANDGTALGTTALMFSDLFLASGSVINLNNGDVTLTHGTDTLTVGGGTLVLPAAGLQVGSSVPFSDAAGTLTLQTVDVLDATSESTIEAAIDTTANLTSIQGQTVSLSAPLTVAADPNADRLFFWDDSAGATAWLTLGTGLAITDTTITSSGGGASLALDNLASVAINTALVLGTSDGAALGSTTKQWSDLFLAEGGVLNWDNGDITMTQTNNVLAIAGTTGTTFDGTGQFTRLGLGEASNSTYRLNMAGAGYFANQETAGLTADDPTLIRTGGPNTVGLEVRGTSYSASAFSPSDISGLKFFFKADSLSLSDGDAIGTWTDSSASGNNLTQATASLKPTYKTNIVNSKPVVRFDGSNDALNRTAVSWSTDAMMVFVVTKYTASNYGQFVDYGTNGTGEWNVGQQATTGKPNVYRSSDNTGSIDTTDRSGAFHIIAGNITTGDTTNLYVDGTLVDGPDSVAFTHASSKDLWVGSRSDGYPLSGDIAEIIGYDNTLSAADRQSVEGYLANKYGLTANLPVGHPYISSSPVGASATAQVANLQTWTSNAGTVLSAISPTGVPIPGSNDGAALGTTSLQWSDLFLAEGGVINWDNGDATLTQVNDIVTLAGAELVSQTAANTGHGVVPRFTISTIDTSAVAANIGGGIAFGGTYSGSGVTTWAVISGNKDTATDGEYGGYLAFSTRPHGNVAIEGMRVTSAQLVQFSGANISPKTNDTTALGTTALQFSDLFLAEGGVLNWDNGDATLTQVGNTVTLAGADLVVAGNTIPDAASTRDLGSATTEWDELYLGDDNGLKLGLDQDASLVYDEITDDRVELAGTNADLWIEDTLSLGAQTFTVTDDGVANDTLTVTASYVKMAEDTGANPGNPSIVISETGAKDGDIVMIVRTDANSGTIDVNDSAGVNEQSGNFVFSQFDTITFIYSVDRWVQVAQANN